jgi:DNA polymerase-3 subunit delta'
MKFDGDLPEADRAEGAPHPRNAPSLIGQDAAAQAFLTAHRTGRLHHAWLITGPPGIGKATLAWRIARFLLAESMGGPGLFGGPDPADSLNTDRDSPRNRRISALSDPALFLLRKPFDVKKGKLKTVITVDEARLLKRFFSLSLADGGRRVVLIDTADDLNTAAANALLKLLEEPPADTVFLMISHMPSRLLPTIRSRCRTLACAPLDADQIAAALGGLLPDLDPAEAQALALLSGGSVGAALRLHMQGGLDLAAQIDAMLDTLPGLDRMKATALAGHLSGPRTDERRALFLDMIDTRLAALARQGVLGHAASPPVPARLTPTPQAGRHWAEAQQTLTGRVRQGLAVNLDPQALILDMVLRLDALAGQCAADR